MRGPKKSQDPPHHWNQPMYGAKTQYADTNMAELVDTHSTLYVHKVCGTFLYYAIAIYQNMLVALNTIATAQAHNTKTTVGDIVCLLKYASTHPDAKLHYLDRDIIFHISRNASCLGE